MTDATPAADDDGFDLIDVTGLSFADVLNLDSSVLGASLRRILEEIDSPRDAVAGWQSAL